RVPEWVGEDEYDCDHEAVDPRRFDDGQPDEEGAAEGVCLIRLLRDRSQRLRNGAPLGQRRCDRSHADGDPCHDDRDDGYPTEITHFNHVSSNSAGVWRPSDCAHGWLTQCKPLPELQIYRLARCRSAVRTLA